MTAFKPKLDRRNVQIGVWNFWSIGDSQRFLRDCQSLSLQSIYSHSEISIDVKIDHSLSRLLSMAEENVEWFVAFRPGNVVLQGCFEEIFQQISETKENTFLLADTLQPEDSIPFLNSQFFIVNLKNWKSLGSPEFLVDARLSVEASADSSESSSSAGAGGGKSEMHFHWAPGWNWLRICQKRYYKIESLAESIKDKLVCLAPQERLENISSQYCEQLSMVKRGSGEALLPPFAKFYREVQMVDVHKTFLSEKGFWQVESRPNKKPLEVVFSSNISFRDLFIIFSHGLFSTTKIVHLYESENKARVKQFLFEKWNGSDLPGFIRDHLGAWSDFSGLEFAPFDYSRAVAQWKDLVTWWGGEESFQRSYQMMKNLKAEWWVEDLVNQEGERVKNVLRESMAPSNAVDVSDYFMDVGALMSRDVTREELITSATSLYSKIYDTARIKRFQVEFYGYDLRRGGFEGETLNSIYS